MDHMKLVLNNGVEINRQCMVSLIQEDFENTKGVIRIRKSTKNRQRNVQKKQDKRTNNDLQNIHIKQKDRLTRTLPKTRGKQFLLN